MSSKTKTIATKEEVTPALVPKLRFPEFRETEEWKNKTLGQMGAFIRGLTYTPSDVADAGLLVLRSGNIQDGSLAFDRDLVFVKKACTPDLLLRVGDVVICMSNGSKALVGKSGEYRDGYIGEVTIGAFCSLFRPSNAFSKIAFQSEQYSDFIGDSIMGGNINNLKNSTLEGFPFPVPPTKAEQQRIAECLSSVDELMAAQARKVDALKTHKKGLMQQLFPRDGETQPRLRFPEFQNAGEWEDDTLGAVCELYQPVTLSSSQLSMTGEHLVYGANGVIGSHNEYNHEESEIAVTCRGATCGEMTSTKPKSWITGNAMIVKPRTNKLRKDFIFQYFKNHGLKSVISGSAQPQITRTGFAPLVTSSQSPTNKSALPRA